MSSTYPFGATVTATGTNFAIFSRHATKVWLLLFDTPTATQPSREILLDPQTDRTGDVWHIHVAGVGHGAFYLYRMDGPFQPERGHRFNPHKPLLDPYAKSIVNGSAWEFDTALPYDPEHPERDLHQATLSGLAEFPKCMVYGDDGFDWQGDRPINRPLNETVIYEMHVRGISKHPSGRAKSPGSYLGLIELIPYFQDLGITSVELLPIHQFNHWEFRRFHPQTGERLPNYWGYNTMAFFAPHAAYAHDPSPGAAVLEFKTMVRALHQAGIEVILDVVFNHTVEGHQLGPTLSFRGIDNQVYYMLEDYPRYYRNYSGVGNTLNVSHPVVQDFVIDCLRYWVEEMHVDGFRFDLAASLCRRPNGHIPAQPPLPIRIAEDPRLRATKMMAEPWDIGGYMVGHFPGGRWAEWNDKYRDQVRQFWRGDPHLNTNVATRLAGSSDLYSHNRQPMHSINFITAHDGFTLNDLVSYNQKHNADNGEDSRDGHNHNISFNHGHEGPTNDPQIERVRNRQVKNFLATLLLSQGTPLINAGDEFRRTQRGNNNAYCQDNEIAWFDWRLMDRHTDVFRFTKHLIALRRNHPIFRRTKFFTGIDHDGNMVSDIRWYRPNGHPADWHSHPHSLMCVMDGARQDTGADDDDCDVVMMLHAGFRTQMFYVPPPPTAERKWHIAVDTWQPPPHASFPAGQEKLLDPAEFYPVGPRSMVVLVSL